MSTDGTNSAAGSGPTGCPDAAPGQVPDLLPVRMLNEYTKRGRVPNNSQRSWEPERVQLMAQGLLLREQTAPAVLQAAASYSDGRRLNV